MHAVECARVLAGAGWGHGPRYWRLGGGGKQGWVK